MPSDLIYFSAIVCEKLLVEADGVPSAIRILDVVQVSVDPSLDAAKRPPYPMCLVALARFDPSKAPTEHRMKIETIDPEGNGSPLLVEQIIPPQPPKNSGTPWGFNGQLTFGLIPKILGTYHFVITVDGEELSRIPVAFIERPANSKESA